MSIKIKYLKTKNYIFIIALCTLFLCSSSYATDSPSGGTATMVRSDDGKHKVIKEACSVCHKEEEFDFLIMIYSTKKKLKKGARPGDVVLMQTEQPKMEFAPTREGEKNFHIQMNCLFCHQKSEDNKPIVDKFISMDGTLSSLCKICHTAVKDFHFIEKDRLNESEILVLLKSYGMKLNPDGTINCITCHTIHSDKAFGRSVRDSFKQFIRESTYFNPHGRGITCIVCHGKKPEPKKKVPFIDKNIENVCRKCHIGDVADHHVTLVKSAESTYVMDFLTLPLLDDKIYCATCHDEVCYKPLNPKNKQFLIGGPYKNKEEFCNKCHKKAAGKDSNPHKQIDKKGNIVKEQCATCHKKYLEEGDKDIALLAKVQDLCSECHIVFDHPDTNHLVEMSDIKMENLKNYSKNFKVNFPLRGKNTITCATCHNPHDKGILKGIGAVGAGEYMYLRAVSFEEACTPCHGKIY